MSTARLFVALDLPGEMRAGLERWARSVVSGGGEGVRVVAAASLHVTLCFLGSIEVGEIEAVGSACREAVTGDGESAVGPVVDPAVGPAVRLEVDEALWLPRRRPRVLAVGLRDRSGGALAALQARIAARLADGGWYEPERRPFLAHVTVARVRRGGEGTGHRGQGRRDAPEAPAGLGGPGSSGGAALAEPSTAPSVTLYRSHTDPAGARYEPLATVALAA